MKIGLISTCSNQTPPLGYGGEIFYWGLADELGKRGHEVHLFAAGGSKTPPNGKLHLIKSGTFGIGERKLEEWIYKKYKDVLMEMDIIHDCSLSHIVAERLNFYDKKKNIVNTINGSVYHEPRPPFNVVTGSRWWQLDALRHGLKTKMVYWGVDTDFYCPNVEKEDYFLWIARFHPDKGLDVALDLAEYLGKKLKVAGSMQFVDHAHYGAKYLERIKSIPNVEYVELPRNSTHHEFKRDLYRKAKAFLYPVIYNECFGLVVAEAMACGTPVITTNMGAMPEIVQNGSGYICETKYDFTKSIQKLEGGFDGIIGGQGARQQSLNFTVAKSTDNYVKIYEEVMQGLEW
jgi:glycosyltransferase involved in cell wall biosynthesis